MKALQESLDAIQPWVGNRLEAATPRAERMAGIIGDRPSQYAKSPSLWNAVFRTMNLDCVYYPFDVDAANLGRLTDALRRTDRLLGLNVTVPYKMKIIEHLDGLDDMARQIGAVNTVVRMEDGRLIGFNTDGSGFLWSLTAPLLAGEAPLLREPKGTDALMIGAGGAARAVAFYLAGAIGGGKLVIANRSGDAARALAEDVNRAFGNARAIADDEIGEAIASVGLVVNCSTKGQSGLRKLADGSVTSLEAYSAFAPANPAVFPEAEAGKGPAFMRRWLEASLADIEQNNHRSAELALRLKPEAVAYDLIYAPLETVFLRHCRLAGHPTANGKGMNIAQAVDAFFNKVCRAYLEARGLHTTQGHDDIVQAMCRAW